MKYVYLDRRIWIDLGKAAKGRQDGEAFQGALAVIRYASQQGLAAFPLSPSTYIEQNGNDNARRRHEQGALMLEISNGLHMTSPGEELVRHEIDIALEKRFGTSVRPQPLRVFGMGTEFAFDIDVKEHITVFDQQPWSGLDPEVIAEATDQIAASFESFALCGPAPGEEDLRAPRTYERIAEEFVAAEIDQADRFAQHGRGADIERRTLLAREAIRLLPDVAQECSRWDIDHGLVYRDAESITDFIMDLPVVSSQMEMLRMQHRDSGRAWTTNDFHDITAFSVAVVHCDAIVIEKHWANLMRRAKLDDRFETDIFDDVRDLVAPLIAAA